MIEQLSNIESVGSAAVQAGIEHVEKHLAKIIKHSEAAAEKDRVGYNKNHVILRLQYPGWA
jgi:hypothetical protein